MHQPDSLKTDDLVPWAWGRGNDVWAMLTAAAEGGTDDFERLYAKAPGLIRCQYEYRRPLHFAVRENQVEATRWLLDHGADATIVSGQEFHDSPQQIAELRGYREVSELLGERLLDEWGIGASGDEIAQAIRARDPARVARSIDKHGVGVADCRGNKPIHWAVMTRQMGLIDCCLSAGGDINAMRPDGARPLDLTNGDYWHRGWRDLHPDAMRNHWPLVGFLIARGADYDLTTACRTGDIERVRELLAGDPGLANADAAYSTWYSGFPLRSAAKAGYLEIVRLLLQHGADPNKPEHGLAPFGGTLYDAVQNNHEDVARLLLEHGADPNQEMESGGNVLHAADHARVNASLRRLLVSHGAKPFEPGEYPDGLSNTESHADINELNWLGVHEIHVCDADRAGKLLDLGVDVDLIDEEHLSTPLGWAVRRGELEKARVLLDRGADPNAAGADWARPIAWAVRTGNKEITQLLKSRG